MSLLKYGGITLCDESKAGILKVELIPDIVVPGKRRNQIQIPGKNGDAVLYDGAYSNVIRKYNVYFSNNFAATNMTLLESVRSVLEKILSLQGYNILLDAYSDDSSGFPDNFYYAELLSDFSVVNTFMRYGRCTLTFNCKPFTYRQQDFMYYLNRDTWTGYSIKKDGNVYSAPLIDFETPSDSFLITIIDSVAGTYKLSIYNMPQMTKATLDCENMTFIGTDYLGVQHNLFQYLEWDYFHTKVTDELDVVVLPDYGVQFPLFYGDWKFTVDSTSGNLHSIGILPRWRNLI